jgi:alpha-tubulin suppressor-like RCC1 family protein
MWGRSGYGSLGQNSRTQYSSPVQVPATTWSTNHSLHFHALHVKTDGTLWSWGENTWGQLGMNDVAHRSSPVQIGSDTTWTQTAIEWRASGGIKTIEG